MQNVITYKPWRLTTELSSYFARGRLSLRVPKTTSGKRNERFNSENTRRNLGFKEDGITTLGGKQ